uniref:Apoptosis antagonizing transcription factor n=1 Tax=Musca domestica TaxID=7370 RepID=T1PII3_MUSDO
MLKKSKQKSVAEKVAEIIAHPNQSDSESENEALSRVRVVDFDEDEYQLPDVGTTEFRKRNVKLLSEQSAKYKGKIASRKDFEEEDDAEEQYEESDDEEGDGNESYEESDDDDEEALKKFGDALKQGYGAYEDSEEDQEDQEEVSEEEEEEDDEEDDDEEEEDEDEEDEETHVISKVNRDAEIQKGICVQNQLKLWERLLEMRINFQKILAKTNQLPSPTEIKELEEKDDKNKSTTQEVTRKTENLLQNLLTLQDTLYGQNSELSKSVKPSSIKRPWPFKQKSSRNDEPPMKQMNNYLQERFDNFSSYRNSVLLKWDDRTKLLQPGAGAKKKSMNEEYDIIKKINNALMNKSLLIEKSQQVKNNAQKQNSEDVENQGDLAMNSNIYDDSDFYHQQLRELIEYKANTTSNMSEVTKQYLELQKLRQKMKKKVDTRASKGRKLRYVVHNKLINFMAPHDNCSWNDESKDELCKSLFV